MSIVSPSIVSVIRPLFVVWFLVAVGFACTAHARSDIRGVWINHTGKGAVELRKCGKNKGICGYIVWLKKPKKDSGEPYRDALNPNPSKRRRPICGLQVIRSLTPVPGGSWDNGRIYDPEKGKEYDVAAIRVSQNKLKITGYLGIKMLGKSFVWRRANGAIERCQVGSE